MSIWQHLTFASAHQEQAFSAKLQLVMRGNPERSRHHRGREGDVHRSNPDSYCCKGNNINGQPRIQSLAGEDEFATRNGSLTVTWHPRLRALKADGGRAKSKRYRSVAIM